MTAAPPLPEGFAARMKERREQLGWTKSRLALQADVSRGTVHEIENGARTNMLADTVLKLETALSLRLRPEPTNGDPTPQPLPSGRGTKTGRRLVLTIEVWVNEVGDL